MAFTLLYGSEKQDISWAECKPYIANPKALAQTMEQVSDFDISSKDPYLIQLAIQMLEEAQLDEGRVKAVSSAAWCLYKWVVQIV